MKLSRYVNSLIPPIIFYHQFLVEGLPDLFSAFFFQNVYYTGNQQIHVGVLSPTIDDDDNRCLVDVNSRPRLIECSYAKAKRMKLYWQFTQVFFFLLSLFSPFTSPKEEINMD